MTRFRGTTSASILQSMHLEIFSPEQTALLPLLQKFAKKYYSAGGTAIALHIGHRKSTGFDLFTEGKVYTQILKKQVTTSGFSSSVIYHDDDEIHFNVNGIRLGFSQLLYSIPGVIYHKNYFRIPDLTTLAAINATALEGRKKWKDDVDLYFILKHHGPFQKICDRATEIFSGVFNSILFSKQLCYFKDINFAEPVEFMPGFEVSEEEIKAFLTDAALTGF